ncbi:MAG: nitrogen fixation protein NifH, partial [Anaerolineae bacterium]|nr:nitrogen fixation protein NifH [Anaerolineae bacterium]
MPSKVELDEQLLDWLLEDETPDARYLTLRDLLHRHPDDSELTAACAAAHERGEIAAVLNAMHSDGYWVKPGAGYAPKYHGTVWSIILLAQLGASVECDVRVQRA